MTKQAFIQAIEKLPVDSKVFDFSYLGYLLSVKCWKDEDGERLYVIESTHGFKVMHIELITEAIIKLYSFDIIGKRNTQTIILDDIIPNPVQD